jgi:hypothetical protein
LYFSVSGNFHEYFIVISLLHFVPKIIQIKKELLQQQLLLKEINKQLAQRWPIPSGLTIASSQLFSMAEA